MNRIHSSRLAVLIMVAAACACSNSESVPKADTAVPPIAAAKSAPTAFRIPQESEIKDSVMLTAVRRGRALVHSTNDSLPKYVGASLTCANCHVADGTQRDAMPLVGSYARFPQFRTRSASVELIEDRINDCFERSMNGKALPRDGRDMHDMVAYLAFLSRGVPVGGDIEGQGLPPVEPILNGDTARGQAVFAANCIACHGVDGQGTLAGPPVWGPKSFNIGAGMSRVNTAARFIHKMMPRDRPGSLTPQQAYDVATYLTSRPRPDFARKAEDWPKGGAPPDVAYPTRASQTK